MKKGLYLLLLLAGIIGLIGCSKTESAEDRMKDFVKDWNGGHYDKMYQSLTQDEKKKRSKKDFVKRYETVYEQAGVKNLKVTAEKQDEDDKKKDDLQHIDYKVSMDTKAGKVAFENTAVLKKKKQTMENHGTSTGILLLFSNSFPMTKPCRSQMKNRSADKFTTKMEKVSP